MNIEIKDVFNQVIVSSDCKDLKDACENNSHVLINADLRGDDLRNSNLSGSDMSGANLNGADFRGAYLSGAKLADADFEDAYVIKDVRMVKFNIEDV